jgi:hypothetical protein
MEEIDNMEGKLAGVIAVSRKDMAFSPMELCQ